MAIIATAVLAVAAINNAGAQLAFGNASISDIMYFDDSTTNPGMANYSTSDLSTINVRAVKNFQKAFKGANASWYKAEDGGYVANFKNGEVKNIIAYDAKGDLHHSIRYYEEKFLPRDVRSSVKGTYFDYEIAGVSEVSINDQVIYIITLQNETSIKMVRVCDGEMEEIKSLKRG